VILYEMCGIKGADNKYKVEREREKERKRARPKAGSGRMAVKLK